MIATYGVDAVAGFGIAMRVEPIFLLVFYSLSAVTSPFMGQNYAANRYDRVAEARIVIGRFCLFFGMALAVVMVGVAEPVASLFSETDAITDIAVEYLVLDTLRVPRETFVQIWSAWRDGYTDTIVRNTSLTRDDVIAYFEDMIVYELHVGSFSGEDDGIDHYPGRYRDVVDAHIDHLVDLGINVVELMPIAEFARLLGTPAAAGARPLPAPVVGTTGGHGATAPAATGGGA